MRLLSITLLVFLIVGSVFATTFRIPGEYPAIQTGLNFAVTGDTVLVANGVYTGTDNRNLNFNGQDIVLMSENGPHTCIIDCENLARGISFMSGETPAAQVIGFTITNARYTMGAGIYCYDSSPTFKNCIIHDCQAGAGGGAAAIFFGAPSFYNCVFHSNSAREGGGVSAESADVTLNSCVIAANSSSG